MVGFTPPHIHPVSWLAAVEEAYGHRKLMLAEMAADTQKRVKIANLWPVEVGSRSFIATSTSRLL